MLTTDVSFVDYFTLLHAVSGISIGLLIRYLPYNKMNMLGAGLIILAGWEILEQRSTFSFIGFMPESRLNQAGDLLIGLVVMLAAAFASKDTFKWLRGK